MDTRPSAYPPPVAKDEFVTEPTAGEDEAIEVGALFVGAGPAGLAGAIRLAQRASEDEAVMESLGEVPIAVLDKARTIGGHQLSGAVVNPASLQELLPGVPLDKLASYGEVTRESVYVLTPKKAMRIPTPPPFHNKGNHVFSVSRLTRALAERAEELGVMPLPETSAEKLLVKDGAVRGVRTGDKGRDKNGGELANFEPGDEVHGGVTVLSEGTQGHLSLAAMDHFDLHGQNPQVWALGVKEIWKVAKPLDRIIHTMGWPLRMAAKWHEFGGSFIYPMGEEHLCIGLVVGLDSTDAMVSVHDMLQELKLHPLIAGLLEGGERVSWGAKTIPEGGFFSLPSSLSMPGAVIVGDAAGMVNVPKLKGVQYAIRSGMLAADTIFDVLKAGGGTDSLRAPGALAGYDERFRASEIHADLYRVRNMKQAFHKGFFVGGAISTIMDLTGGKFPGKMRAAKPDSDAALTISDRTWPAPDGKRTFDKLSSVFLSGNRTRDDQPNHVRIETKVPREVALGWVNMCPAEVYEIDDAAGVDADGRVTVAMAPSNCVHCGAITAKGGRLTPPEGGSGPEYTQM